MGRKIILVIFLFEKWLVLATTSFLLLSCTSEIDVSLNDKKGLFPSNGQPTIHLASDSESSGSFIEQLKIAQFSTTKVYAIEIESSSNVPVTWRLQGNIGNMNASSDGKSATISASTPGTGILEIMRDNRVVRSIEVFVEKSNNSIKNLEISNITSNSFSITLEAEHPLVDADSATFHYCNDTKIPNCDPKDWYSITMNKNSQSFDVNSPAFKFPDDPKDTMNIEVTVELNGDSYSQSEKVQLDGPAQIYRSIGPGNTSALAERSNGMITNEASIEDSTITFESALPDNVGIGDVIVCGLDTTVGLDDVFFIRKRISSNQFVLNDKDGAELTTDYPTLYDWEIYRAYTNVPDTDTLTENTGIPAGLSDFDTSLEAVSDNKAWHFAFYADAPYTSPKHDLGDWDIAGDNFLRYYVPFLPTEVGVSQRHSGYWDASKATITINATQDYYWAFMQRGSGKDALRIEGFQFQINANGFAAFAVRLDDYLLGTGSYAYIHHNIIVGDDSGNGGAISHMMGEPKHKLYSFSNIAYNLGGTAFASEGEMSIQSHNTSIYNDWNFYGPNSDGRSTINASISYGSSTDEYRGSFSTDSSFNTSDDTTARGSDPITNVTLGELSFVNTTPGSENFCTDSNSVAFINGPRRIDETDAFKIYYDAAGNLRTPKDLFYPIGACSTF